MLQLDDFSYCNATKTCRMDWIFRNLLSTQIFTYSNASTSQILQYQGPILQCQDTLGVQRTPNQTEGEAGADPARKFRGGRFQ